LTDRQAVGENSGLTQSGLDFVAGVMEALIAATEQSTESNLATLAAKVCI